MSMILTYVVEVMKIDLWNLTICEYLSGIFTWISFFDKLHITYHNNVYQYRLRDRAKAREKRAYARANNLSLGPSRKLLKKSTMAISPCKLMVTIDLSFDELMIDKDIAKLTKQILRCYTLNRRAIAPMQFSLTSFTGRSRADMEKHNGYEHWDVCDCFLYIRMKAI